MRRLLVNWILIGAVCTRLASSCFGQGTFQNLDFEDGVFIPVGGDPYIVAAAPALPGWTSYVGTNELSSVLHNTISLSPFAQIAIWGPDEPQPGLFHGQYYVLLRGGNDPFGGLGTVDAALSQTGMIPSTAQSIRFYFASGNVTLRFGGQGIALSSLGSSPAGYTIFGGDVSALAGQTGELRFQGGGYLDFIQFSNQPITEPSVLGLLTIGALLLGWQWRRSSSNK